jgi:hypothetical protein
MKTSLLRALSLGLAALPASACAPDDFDPGSRVTSLRVLAVHADLPYAAPGETVNLDTLSFDPLGRPLSWAWAACVTPPSSDVYPCFQKIALDAAAGIPPLIGEDATGDSVSFTVPPDLLDNLPEVARPAALIGVVGITCPGSISLDPEARPLPVHCNEAGSGRELPLEEYVVGIKRIFVRQTDKNQNPVIERVSFDGEDWAEDDVKEVDACSKDGNVYDDCKNVRHKIAAYITPDSFESGTDEYGRTFDESLIVQHYSTEGIFEDEVRIGAEPESHWAARLSAAGTEVTLWFVARDDRGGVTWTTRRVRVR